MVSLDDRPITILVADQLALVADSLSIALDLFPDLSIIEEHPTNGPWAIEAITRLKPDLALIDFWMPDMEGPAIIASVHDKVPECKLVLSFWMSTPAQLHQALKAGPAAFVSKEGSVAELAEILRRVHTGQFPYFDPRMDYLIKPGIHESSDDWKRFQALTSRQVEILALLNLGLSTQQVATRLEINSKTVRNQISSILTTLNSKSSTEALARARACGFIRT